MTILIIFPSQEPPVANFIHMTFVILPLTKHCYVHEGREEERVTSCIDTATGSRKLPRTSRICKHKCITTPDDWKTRKYSMSLWPYHKTDFFVRFAKLPEGFLPSLHNIVANFCLHIPAGAFEDFSSRWPPGNIVGMFTSLKGLVSVSFNPLWP